jgi:6-phosphogluconolactonase
MCSVFELLASCFVAVASTEGVWSAMNIPGELLVGRYAEPGVVWARSRGEQVADFGVRGTRNASFAAYSRRHERLYAMREDDRGMIDVLTTEGGLQWVARVPSAGGKPCHCALDASEGFLAVANYESGEVTVFTLDPRTGLPRENPWQYRGAGQGPDKERQTGPHAHWVGFAPDQRWLISTDLGADRIRAFPFDPDQGVMGGDREAYVAQSGSGPRWLAFLGDGHRAILVSELASTITLLSWHDGWFEVLDCCPISPTGGDGSLGGHIVLDATCAFAYVTERGDDTVAAFSISGKRLSYLGAVTSGGVSPRFLCWLDERTLLVAHEEDGPITALHRQEDGRLAARGPYIWIDKAAWLMPQAQSTAAR